jgi:hypothetical protein
LTYLDDFTHNIDRVTVAQIRDAFARHVNPQAMATVIVGAPETGNALSSKLDVELAPPEGTAK